MRTYIHTAYDFEADVIWRARAGLEAFREVMLYPSPDGGLVAVTYAQRSPGTLDVFIYSGS